MLKEIFNTKQRLIYQEISASTIPEYINDSSITSISKMIHKDKLYSQSGRNGFRNRIS